MSNNPTYHCTLCGIPKHLHNSAAYNAQPSTGKALQEISGAWLTMETPEGGVMYLCPGCAKDYATPPSSVKES